MKQVEATESGPQSRGPSVERIPVPKGELCIITEWCKGCGFCIEFCTKNVLAAAEGYNRKGYHPPKVVNAQACTHCDACEMICPDFAIFTVKLAEIASADSGEEA